MTTTTTITVKLPGGATEVLELDDPAPRYGGPTSLRYTRAHVYVTATLDVVKQIQSMAEARSGSGWDQPAWYYRTARATAKAIRQQIEEASA